MNQLVWIFSPLVSEFSFLFFALTSLKINTSYCCLSIKFTISLCSSSPLCLFLNFFVQSSIIFTRLCYYLLWFLLFSRRETSEKLLIQILLLLLLLDLEIFLSLFLLKLFLSFLFQTLFLLLPCMTVSHFVLDHLFYRFHLFIMSLLVKAAM